VSAGNGKIAIKKEGENYTVINSVPCPR